MHIYMVNSKFVVINNSMYIIHMISVIRITDNYNRMILREHDFSKANQTAFLAIKDIGVCVLYKYK